MFLSRQLSVGPDAPPAFSVGEKSKKKQGRKEGPGVDYGKGLRQAGLPGRRPVGLQYHCFEVVGWAGSSWFEGREEGEGI